MSRMVDVKKTKRENASRLMKTIVNNKTVGGEIRAECAVRGFARKTGRGIHNERRPS